MKGEECPALFLDWPAREPKTRAPTWPRTRLAFVRQLDHRDAETVEADAVAREAHSVWMELDAHSTYLPVGRLPGSPSFRQKNQRQSRKEPVNVQQLPHYSRLSKASQNYSNKMMLRIERARNDHSRPFDSVRPCFICGFSGPAGASRLRRPRRLLFDGQKQVGFAQSPFVSGPKRQRKSGAGRGKGRLEIALKVLCENVQRSGVGAE